MNKFENTFFTKCLPENHEIRWIIHIHFIDIFSKLFLWISFWVIIPTLFYYNSWRIQIWIPFHFLELFLILIFIKIIYDIFNWYNDVLIVTNMWLIKLERSLFKTNTKSVEYDKIEWMEVEIWWLWDKIFKKWNILIHKIWDDSFFLWNANNPYKWVDLIEETANEAEIVEETNDNKFDVIMEALWWVVENYLDKKMTKIDKQKEIEKVIEEIEKNTWTIDLR